MPSLLLAVPPPGPRQFPWIRNSMHLVGMDFEALLPLHADKYGPISRLRTPNREVVLVTSPELVREVCVVQAANFPDREYEESPVSDGCPGIVSSQGSDHTLYRGALNPSYFSPAAVAGQQELAMEETQRLLAETGRGKVSMFLMPQGASHLVSFVHALSLRIQYRVLFNHTLPPPLTDREANHTAVPLRPSVAFVARLAAQLAVSSKQLRACTFRSGGNREPFMGFVRAFTNRERQIRQTEMSLRQTLGPRKRDAARAAARVLLSREAGRGAASPKDAPDPLRLVEARAICEQRLLRRGTLPAAAPPRAVAPWADVISHLEGKVSLTEAVALAQDLVAAGSDTTAAAVTMTLSEVIQAGLVYEVAAEARSAEMPLTKACVKESLRLHP